MNSKRFAMVMVVLSGAGAVGPATAADRLVFNSVAPCRLIDTRAAVAGALAANETRTFHVVGSTSDFAAQGGRPGGCGLPGFAGGQPQVQAVFINLVAVNATGAGDLRAWASDGAVPSASIINYAKVMDQTLTSVPLNIANGIGLPVRQDVEGADISLKADVSSTHVVADVVGYWRTISLPAGAVGTPEIADGAVTAAKIASGAVVKSLNGQTDAVTIAATNGLSGSTGAGTVTLSLDTAFTDARYDARYDPRYVNVGGDAMAGTLDMNQNRVVNRGCHAGHVRVGPGLCTEFTDQNGFTFTGCANRCGSQGTHMCTSSEMRHILASGVTLGVGGVLLDWIDDQDAAGSALFVNSSVAESLDAARPTSTSSFCRCCANVE